jgi:hypothetical protein
MVVGTRRPARRGDKDELMLCHLLLRRGQRFRGSGFGGGNIGSFLLRVRGLFEGVVVGSDLILVLIPRTGRRLLGGRPEASINVRTRQLIQNETTRFSKENLRRIDPELRKDFLL